MDGSVIATFLTDLVTYQKDVLSRFLNPDFVDIPLIVNLSQEQVSHINGIIEVCRPQHRLQKSIPLKDMPVLLLPDYCSLPSGLKHFVHVTGSVISVEIKPKQGFRNPLDRQPAAAYCLKQFQKMGQGSISCRSLYCPLDLFSGCADRQRQALLSLIQTPQNNFRVFKDLDFAYGEERRTSLPHVLSGTFADSNSNDNPDAITESFIKVILQALTSCFDSHTHQAEEQSLENQESLCQLHTQHSVITCSCANHFIASRSVLGNVLTGQKLDAVACNQGLEMAQYLYSSDPNFLTELKLRSFCEIREGTQAAKESKEDFYLRLIWQYFVSMTFKDCSILITMQRLADSDQPDTSRVNDYRCRIITCDRTGVSFVVSVAIVDLDPRFPQSYDQLRQKISQKDFSAIKISDRNANCD